MSNNSNQVCVMTGATSGIGRALARVLAEREVKLFLIGRDQNRAARLLRAIRKTTQSDTAVFLPCELTDLDQIKAAAAAIKAATPGGITLLVNNAHVRLDALRTASSGVELTFAVNHLAYFALTGHLLESLLIAPEARILNVAGDACMWGDPLWENSVRPVSFVRGKALATSKLANVVFTLELARRLQGTSVTVNTAHPGIVATRAGTGGHPLRLFKYYLYYLLRGKMISARTAALPLADLCLSETYRGVTGSYFSNGQPSEASLVARKPEVAASLWKLSLELTRLDSTLGPAWRYYSS